MRSRSVALSRLAVLPAAALAVAVTPLLTSAHSAQSAQSAQSHTSVAPVAAVRALTTDFPASHALSAHQSALRAGFFVAVEQARREAAIKQFYTGIQRAHDEAALRQFYSGVQQARDEAARQQAAQVAAPAPAAAPTAGSNLNWSALAACESSGNPAAVSSGGYMGLYQFDQRTWESVGGSGSPTSASAAEQTLRASILYSQRGSSPWPVCGARL
jgi:hypothetical protein